MKWKKELYQFITAVILIVLTANLLGVVNYKAYRNLTLDNNPFLEMNIAAANRTGNQISFVASVTQTEFCELNKDEPPFFRFSSDTQVISSDVKINDKPFIDRSPFIVGKNETIGVLSGEIPEQLRDEDNLVVQLVIRCSKEDGITRSFLVNPVLSVPVTDGVLKPLK